MRARRRAVQTLKSGGGITFLKASASSGAAFVLAKADADGHSYTESLKSGGITFILLVLLEAAPARAAA